MKKLFIAALVLLATAASAQTMKINGAGATFPNPIYTKWFDQYHNMHANVEINYQSIGSGGGIRQLSPAPSSSALGRSDDETTRSPPPAFASSTCRRSWAAWCRSTTSPRSARS